MKNPRGKHTESTTKKSDQRCVLLIAADADEAAKFLGGLVAEERFRVEWVTGLSSGVLRLREGEVEAAVLDLSLLDGPDDESINEFFQAASGVPVLVLSDAGMEETARKAVQHGAQDYLLKEQTDSYRLRRAMHAMLDRRAMEVETLKNEIAMSTLDSIQEAVFRTDDPGRQIIYLNRFAEEMTGWLRKEALGRPITDVLRLVDNTNCANLDHAETTFMHRDIEASSIIHNSHSTLLRRDGVEVEIEYRETVVENEAGDLIGKVITLRDVGVALAASLEISRVAQHDVLTHLPNRMLLHDRLTQAISLADRQSKHLAILFIDLDQFKRINDSLGHAMGDKLLRSVAGRLTACVRRADTVCRFGGDEFVILLSQIEHAEDAAVCARKILRAVAVPHIIGDKSVDVSVSIGASTYPGDAQEAESLMSQADAAMYEAKIHGRNGFQVFRNDMRSRIAERLSLEGDLRYALGRKELLLHYQPKVNLLTGEITGMEALVRWQHPNRGMLFPASFLSIAEESGLIVSIGRWVLLEACRQARSWRDSGTGTVPVAVNVSAAEFRSKDFLSGVRAVLIATGVEPINLELELTETALMEDAESAIVTLTALQAMGVRLAIDDFGTGYSSFTYLRRFPVNTLKLDLSFVQEIGPDPDGVTLVSGMIGIGKSLNKRVIAEGIETRSQLDYLQRHGSDEGQGYYFSRPVGAEQAGNLFKTGLLSYTAELSLASQ